MPFGELTPEQRADALGKAREARQARARLIQQIRAGEVTISDILADDNTNPVALKLPVRTMLRALPGVGVQTVEALCITAHIPENRRVRGLSANQRDILLEALER